jgi:hypothetical protein
MLSLSALHCEVDAAAVVSYLRLAFKLNLLFCSIEFSLESSSLNYKFCLFRSLLRRRTFGQQTFPSPELAMHFVVASSV